MAAAQAPSACDCGHPAELRSAVADGIGFVHRVHKHLRGVCALRPDQSDRRSSCFGSGCIARGGALSPPGNFRCAHGRAGRVYDTRFDLDAFTLSLGPVRLSACDPSRRSGGRALQRMVVACAFGIGGRGVLAARLDRDGILDFVGRISARALSHPDGSRFFLWSGAAGRVRRAATTGWRKSATSKRRKRSSGSQAA